MKKTAILATALAAALCLAPLAACGDASGSGATSVEIDGKPFNMADYAVELPENMMIPNNSYREIPAFKSFRKLNVQLYSLSWYGSEDGSSMEFAQEVGKDTNSGKYRLFNLKTEQSLTEWYSSISLVSSGSPFIVLEDAENN